MTSDGLKGHLTQQQPVKQEPVPEQIKKRTSLCRINKGLSGMSEEGKLDWN